jgi:hypothetical protein
MYVYFCSVDVWCTNNNVVLFDSTRRYCSTQNKCIPADMLCNNDNLMRSAPRTVGIYLDLYVSGCLFSITSICKALDKLVKVSFIGKKILVYIRSSIVESRHECVTSVSNYNSQLCSNSNLSKFN